MTSSLFQPLERTLRNMITHQAQHQREVLHLVKTTMATEINQRTLEQDLLRLNRSILKVVEDNTNLVAIAAKMQEPPHTADKLADLAMRFELMDYAQNADYLGLARFIENMDSDHYEMAIRELATFEGGLDKIQALSRAINNVLQQKGT